VAHVVGNVAAVPPPGALERQVRQVLGRGAAVGETLGRVAVADLLERKAAALGNRERSLHREGIVGIEIPERDGSSKPELGVGLEQTPCGPHRDPVADRGENVLEIAPLPVVVEHFHPGHDGNVGLRGFVSESSFMGYVHVAPVPGGERVEAIVEGFAQELERALAKPQSEQTFRMLGDCAPGDRRASFLRSKPASSHETAEVAVPLVVLGEQHDRGAVVDRDLRSDDEMKSDFQGFQVSLDDAVDSVPIGQG